MLRIAVWGVGDRQECGEGGMHDEMAWSQSSLNEHGVVVLVLIVELASPRSGDAQLSLPATQYVQVGPLHVLTMAIIEGRERQPGPLAVIEDHVAVEVHGF